MRVLGLDVGERRIGVALSDIEGLLARPLTVVVVSDEQKALQDISELCNSNKVECVVVGLPKSLDGTIGRQAERVQQFCGKLAGFVKLPIETWDERFSTVEAERAMIAAGTKRGKKKQLRDSIAAAIILQGYLDRKRNE